jgi:putative DNA primase/helicase
MDRLDLSHMTSADVILSYLVGDCDLFAFPVHSISDTGGCTCKKGPECNSPGKHPFLNVGWKKLATNNLEKLRKITKNKIVNYAVATGRKSSKTGKYLVVVDVDQKEHEILKLLPKTFSYKTGSGGYHYWFWSPVEIKNSVSKIASKVDIRGTGGYVIIPPSRHKSGQKYELLHGPTQPILDFPGEISSLIAESASSSRSASRKKSGSKKLAGTVVDKNTTDWWTKTPVKNIRSTIQAGVLIPSGVRNVTIHRLLSSDRAKGVATYEELMTLAGAYRAHLEVPETFDARELRNIVVSVMRYPVYNTQAENVNKNYVKWLKKNGTVLSLDTLEKADACFFGHLSPSKNFVSLAQVANVRKEWYSSVGITDFATYKPQLLANKLRSLGFSRTRTAKSNLWNVDVNILLAQEISSCDHNTNRRLEMSEEASETTAPEAEETATEETTAASGPIGPDGLPMTLLEEREEVIETDRKYNPDDFKYNGQRSNQELMMAQIKLYEQISSEQEKDYENGTLLFDEERTRDFMGALEVEDVLGLKTVMCKVRSVGENEIKVTERAWDKFTRKYHFDTEEQTVSIYDLDNALSMGVGQILYRKDKPFGLDKEMAYKVKVKVYADSVGRTYVFRTGKEITPAKKSQEDTEETKDDRSAAKSP